MHLSGYLESFLSHLEAQNYSEHTVRAYKNSLDLFKPYLNCKSIDIAALQKVIDNLASAYKPATMHTRIAALKAFFDYLILQGITQSNPVRRIASPRMPDTLPKALEYGLVEEALEKSCRETSFMGLRDHAIMELGYATGARANDIISAKLDKLDLAKCVLKVIGKGEVEAILLFGRHAREALIAYLRERPKYIKGEDHGRLFIRLDGDPINSIYQIVKKYSGHGPHVMFRHSAATHMLENGADISTVSEFLRHKTLNTTRIYTRMTGEKLRRKYERYHPRA